MIRLLLTMIFLFPLFLTAETIIVKTKLRRTGMRCSSTVCPKVMIKNGGWVRQPVDFEKCTE